MNIQNYQRNSKNMNPKVSICIPTYNGGKYLKECLDSALSQSFQDYEVIISDDLSEDDTLQIAKEYEKKDNRIKVFQNKKNVGLVHNWNHCINLSEGEWIKFLFQDDFLSPDCLSKMIETSKENQDILLISCKRHLLIEKDVDPVLKCGFLNIPTINDIFGSSTILLPLDICKTAFNNIGVNFIGEPTLTLVHKSAFSKYGFFNSNLVQLCDLEYWLRIASEIGMIYIHEELATFRLHGTSTTSGNRKRDLFRMGNLDTLILLHELAINPIFKNFRKTIKKEYPDKDILDILSLRVRETRIKALKSKERRKDLKKVLDAFPSLKVYDKWVLLYPELINELLRLTKKYFIKAKA